METKPTLVISSPHSNANINDVLGFSHYSHLILAKKIASSLSENFECVFVSNQKELSTHVKALKNKGLKVFHLHVGQPDTTIFDSRCRNFIFFTWEFGDLPTSRDTVEHEDWTSTLRKFDHVLIPNEILSEKFRKLQIPFSFVTSKGFYSPTVFLEKITCVKNLSSTKATKLYTHKLPFSEIKINYESRNNITEKIFKKMSRMYFEILKAFIPNKVDLVLKKLLFKLFFRKIEENLDSLFTSVDNLGLELFGKVVISTWLNISDSRKNFETLVLAYFYSAREIQNTVLLVKVIGGTFEEKKAMDIILRIAKKLNFRIPQVLLISSFLEQIEFSSLINVADIYINTSSAEGICLPAMEHGATGALMVLPKNTAFLSNFSGRTNSLVEVDTVPTFFPVDSSRILKTSWSPPIFSSLISILSSSFDEEFTDEARARRQALFFQNQNSLEENSDITLVLKRLTLDYY
jgi:glycosyltransferase involved in cell wall biosynthesis